MTDLRPDGTLATDAHVNADISTLDVRDDVLELASRYETVRALDLAPDPTLAVKRSPGSRVPPGVQEFLNEDEVSRALNAVDDWAAFVGHVIAEERDVTMPDLTPARLRAIAEHIEHIVRHPDELLALSVLDDLRDLLRGARQAGTAAWGVGSGMRALSSRGVKRVQTGVRCREWGCEGRLESPLGTSDDRHEASLVCDKDGRHVVPYSVWSGWPRARVQYVTIEHAARMLGTTVNAVRIRASRGQWGRIGTGRDVRYAVKDVREAAGLDDGEAS